MELGEIEVHEFARSQPVCPAAVPRRVARERAQLGVDDLTELPSLAPAESQVIADYTPQEQVAGLSYTRCLIPSFELNQILSSARRRTAKRCRGLNFVVPRCRLNYSV